MPDLFVSGFAHLIPMLSKRLKETSQGTSNQQEFEQSHMAVSSSARTGYVGKFTGLFSSKKAKKTVVSWWHLAKKRTLLLYAAVFIIIDT